MNDPQTWRLLADAVLVLHLGIVAFVVGGLAIILAGNRWHWRWVNSLGLRVAHLVAIGVVVVQAWLGSVCPFTLLESWLRRQAGAVGYTAGFIETWVQRVLYFDAPHWAFVLAYSVFGLLVVAAWRIYPPGRQAVNPPP